MSVNPAINMNRNAAQIGDLKLSQIELLDDRCIIEEIIANEMSTGGIVLPDSARRDHESPIVPVRILSVGPGKKMENGTYSKMRVKVGDKAHCPRFKGERICSMQWIENDCIYVIREEDLVAIELED